MADDVVGSVKVRIRPDTTTFADETEDGVKKAVDKVNRKAKTQQALKVQLHATLRTEEIFADAKSALRDINTQLRTNDNLKVQFRAQISKTGMLKTVREARKHLQLLADAQKAVDFKATLSETELSKVRESIKQLGAQIEEDLSPKLKMRLDEGSLNEVRSGMATVMAALADLKRIDIEVGLDEDSLLAELARLEALEATLPMKLKVDESSVASMKAAVAAIDAELTKIAEIEIDVHLDEPSLLAARAKFTKQIELMEAQTRALAEAQKKAAKQAEEAARKAAKEAEQSAQNFQKMSKNVGSAVAAVTGFRLITGIFRHFRDFFTNLDKKLPLIGSLALAMAGLGGVALDSAGGIFALSRALAQIGPGAVALPGIFAGIAIGMGAWIFLLKDIKKIVPELDTMLSTMGDRMRSAFAGAAEGPLTKVVFTLLPIFERGIVKTSTALGIFTGALADAFRIRFDGKVLPAMFGNLNKSITIFTGYAGSIARIFRILGGAGSKELPVLAQWFGTLTERFANFLRESEKSGAITGWIETAKARLASLWDVLVQGWGILTGLARAADNASAGDALTNLANSLARVNEVVNSSNFQTKFTNLLIAADEMMAKISEGSGAQFMAFWDTFSVTLTTILPKAGEAIGTLAGAIYDMLGSAPVQNGLVALFDGLAKGAAALAPAFEVLGPKMGATLTLLGTAFEQIGGILAAVIIAVAPIATAIMETLTPVIEKLGPIIKKIAEDMAPVFANVGDIITKMKDPLLGLVDAFGNLWDAIGPLLIPALQILHSLIGGALIGIIQGVTLAFQGIADVVGGVREVFSGLKDIVMGFIEGLKTGDWSTFTGGFKKVFSGLKGIVVGAFKAVVGVVWAFLNGTILGIIRGGAVKLLLAWKGGWKGIFNFVKSIWKNIVNAVKGAWNGLKNFVGNGISALKGLWTRGWNGIKTAATNVWKTIRTAVSNGINNVKSFITNGINTIKGFWSSGWQGIKSTLSNAWQNMRTAASEGKTKIVNFVKEIPSKAKAALSGIGSKLLSSGTALMQGFLEGITGKFGEIKGKVEGFLRDLRGAFPFSPAKWGPFSGKGYTTHSGKALIEDFGNGMLLGVPHAKEAANTSAEATKEALDKATDRAKKAVRTKWLELGKDLATQVTTGLKQNLSGIRSTLSSIIKDMPEQISKATEKKIGRLAASLNKKIDTLEDLMGQIEDKVQEIKDAATDFANSAVEAMTTLGDPTSLGALELEDPEISFDDIVKNYETAIQRATDFSNVINELSGMGLNDATLQQLIAAGPEAGYAAAQAIKDAGAAGVAEVNKLTTDLGDAASGISTTAYDSMFETGMQTAEGYLNGLREKIPDIEAEVLALAKKIRKIMRKALKVNSPSRVFREIGRFTGDGFVLGIQDRHAAAEKAVTDLGSSRPQPQRFSRGALAGAGGSSVNNRTINYYAAPGSQVSGEESLFAALNRARSNGF